MRPDCYDHDDDRSWSMVSTSGRDRVTFRFEGFAKRRDGTTPLICSVRARGEFWDRSTATWPGDLVDVYDLSLRQVMLDGRSLVRLCQKMEGWFDGYEAFRVNLSSRADRDQTMTVAVGGPGMTALRPGKPVYSLAHRCSDNRWRWSFVVDQSCIYLGAGSLGRVLATMGLRP